MPTPPDGRARIDAALVRRLLAAQFPQWCDLPVTPVEPQGWDNRTFRLGRTMTVRLPTAAAYAPAVAKENSWLPRLAPSLPVAVPQILGHGVPGEEYPFPWSIRRWIPGDTADRAHIDDMPRFALSVARFIRAIQRCDPGGGPLAGQHSFYRGAPQAHYDEQTRHCLAKLTEHIDTARATAVWEAALAAEWRGKPVWFHGDIAPGNLLVADGQLTAVIDFGCCGVGDPACDLTVAWTTFSGDSRQAFRQAVDQDKATWARARGWALWKAALTLSRSLTTDPEQSTTARQVIHDILVDHDHDQ
ncbi:aminoglycoside phosphotransferase family protein [Saccharomonospora xinjiangensis]|nr:aminoglycoside phosphotransferase family protein [Saccharomonospora xinjiangensis]